MRVQGGGAHLDRSQALQHFLHEPRLSKLGLGHCAALAVLRSGSRSWSPELPPPRPLIVEDGVGLRPPGEISHREHEVTVPLFAVWEWPCYVNGCPLERGPDP
jgi:hypothetical protein